MQNGEQKNWTILFYLNGNNELAPEILQSRLAVDKEGSDESVDVLVQHSCAQKRIVEIIRPQYSFTASGEEGTQVVRYHVSGSAGAACESLGNINMAHPKSLYDFIEWGIVRYPAEKYMLVLGGHVFQYVGLMPDYSQSMPYLMGYPEMIKALELIHQSTGKKIDLLVLDTCYANRFEMLYEMGKEEDPPIEAVLTYIFGGPLGGLPYNMLIRTVKESGCGSTLYQIIHRIVENLEYDLIAYEINHTKIELIKGLYNDIAGCSLNNKTASCTSPSELLTNFDESLPWHSLLKSLLEKMPCLTICCKSVTKKPFGHFYVSANLINDPYKKSLYSRLAFSKDNLWSNLLYSASPDITIEGDAITDPEPFVLKPSELYALIKVMNSNLDAEQNKQILSRLIAYKGWTWK